jgi:hypothetical protein
VLPKNNGYAMVWIYGFPAIFHLYLAAVSFQLRLQYVNGNVYKKQRMAGFSRENQAGYRPKAITAKSSNSIGAAFLKKFIKTS